MDRVNLFDVRKECRVCGRKYSADSRQRICECGRFLYIAASYWQRKTGGDAGGDKGNQEVVG